MEPVRAAGPRRPARAPHALPSGGLRLLTLTMTLTLTLTLILTLALTLALTLGLTLALALAPTQPWP